MKIEVVLVGINELINAIKFQDLVASHRCGVNSHQIQVLLLVRLEQTFINDLLILKIFLQIKITKLNFAPKLASVATFDVIYFKFVTERAKIQKIV